MRCKRIKVWIGIGSLVGGGAEKQVELLVNQLDPERFDLRVAFVKRSSKDPHYPKGVSKRYLKRSAKWRWDQVWKEVYRELKEWQPDVVHVWLPEVISLPGSVCARLLGIPCITSIRRSCFKGIGWRNWGRESLNMLPHLFGNHIVANFPLDGELPLLKNYWKWRSAQVIPNGVRRSTRTSFSPPKALDKGGALKFVYVGRFAVQKRLPFLIETLAQVPELPWRLTVFGRGSSAEESSLRKQVNQFALEDRIFFAGFASDWRKEASKFDYMLFPSVSEGMPNVVVEAMAEGLPVIGSRISELSNILFEGKNGLFFEPDDVSSLIEVICQLEGRRGEYPDYSREAFETATRFSLDALGAAYEDLYSTIAQEK
jgi:glycosyltransferase involved in cell wall biosynthesis